VTSPIRVLVADDQKIVRDGLAMLLGYLPGIEVVGTAVDGADAVAQARAMRPDIVLMDLNMPGTGGVEATRQLAEFAPDVRVVVLTTYSDDESVFAALQAGARGYLTKDAGAEEISRAIVSVASGDAQLDPSVQRRLLDALAKGSSLDLGSGIAAAPSEMPDELTAREVDVLIEIAAGLSNAEIAATLFVSEATVKTHINHLLAKTGHRDRAQLVGYAFRRGLARP
jgi:DNA-binding NarL/FixJ family response regulator